MTSTGDHDPETERPVMQPGATQRPKAKPSIGFLILLVGLTLYAFMAAALGDLMVEWSVMVQFVYYVIAGIVWIWPARRVLRWALS